MAKITPITEHFQHFVENLKETFWGDLQGEVQRAAKKFFELLSERQRDRYMVCFVNVASVDRIIYSIFQRFNLEWQNRTLKLFTQAA